MASRWRMQKEYRLGGHLFPLFFYPMRAMAFAALFLMVNQTVWTTRWMLRVYAHRHTSQTRPALENKSAIRSISDLRALAAWVR